MSFSQTGGKAEQLRALEKVREKELWSVLVTVLRTVKNQKERATVGLTFWLW